MKSIIQLLLTACILIILQSVPGVCQQTITIQGSDISDAMIQNTTRPGYEYPRTTNYGSYPRLSQMPGPIVVMFRFV